MQLRYPGTIAIGRTASLLHGLWVVGPPGPVHLARPRGYPRAKHDVIVDEIDIPTTDRCLVHGVAVTTPLRTTVEDASRLDPAEALALVDSAVRNGLTQGDLLHTAQRLGIQSRSLDDAIKHADARSQSPLESMSRWHFHVARLPTPELQILIGDEDGPFALVDFLWREAGVIGEADGDLKYDENGDAQRAEEIRQERLERMGFIVVRGRTTS